SWTSATGTTPHAPLRRSWPSSFRDGSGSSRDSGGSRSRSAQGERSGQAVAGGCGVAHEGEDDPEVPGLELRREGVDGPRPRSAEVAARRGPEEGVQAEVRRLAQQEEGARRAEEGGREGGRALRRDRPRPRGRGDRLAPGAR